MNFPNDLYYTSDHEWLRVDNNMAWIGITDYAQSELGDIVYVDVPAVDSKVEKGKSFGTIEAVKAVSDLFAPISGAIREINSEVKEHPEIINKDPYDKGWIIKIEIEDSAQLNELLDVQKYKSLIGK